MPCYIIIMFHEDWYSNEQVEVLCKLAKEVKNLNGSIIEIGCWEGKSTFNLANAIYPETLICNDTWLGNVAESICSGNKHPTEVILENRDVYRIFRENMDKLTERNYDIVKKDCLEWLNEYDGKVKFCHIDASHDYYSVRKTLELLLPKLVNGGILCGDDFGNANMNCTILHGGVERAVREIFPDVKIEYGNFWYWRKP